MVDPLILLHRKDKWFLGGGKGAIYAPPFPKHLLAPGFWDESYLADVRIPRLFTVLFLDEQSKPIRFLSQVEGWQPDCLTILHVSDGIAVRERRCVTETNAWASEFQLLNEGKVVQAFLWSLLDVREPGFGTPWFAATKVDVTESSIGVVFETAWPKELEPDRSAIESEQIKNGDCPMQLATPVFLEFGASKPRLSWTVNLTQRHDDSPLYELSVLPQKFRNGRLASDFKFQVGTEPIEGLVHLVQHYELDHSEPVVFVCGAGITQAAAQASFRMANHLEVLNESARSWRDYFNSVPNFESSDSWLNHAYWYRWYGLRLNTVDIPDLPIAGKPVCFSPFVTEGIGFFRNFVTYSAQAHLREVSWMHDPSLAIGILENLGKCQRADGSFPGHNYSTRPARDFYHADFATGVRQLQRLHSYALPPHLVITVRDYAVYFLNHRWSEAGALIFDQNETGQEYMSRYQFASSNADKWSSFEVVGIDATTYLLNLVSLLDDLKAPSVKTQVIDEIGFNDLWKDWMFLLKLALASAFDSTDRFFNDLKPTGESSNARPATGFYPYLVAEHLSASIGIQTWKLAATQWLFNPSEFWLQKGFPATAKSDPTFSADGEWKDRRLNCPWSGRSWPMANSHLVDGIVNVARHFDDGELRIKAGETFLKAVQLMFHDGDPCRPNSYEHYDPETGVPALYRGYDDYMHSWIVDLILRHAVGVIPGSDKVDPLPLDIEWITCTGIPNCGKKMNVILRRGEEPKVSWE